MRIFNNAKKQKSPKASDVKTQCPQYVDAIENYRVETFKNSTVRIGKVHAIGKRESQQDSFAYSAVHDAALVQEKGMLFLVADGMGGMSNGAEVSATVAVEALKYFDTHEITEDVSGFLYDMVEHVNDAVNEFLGHDGIGKSGSTLVVIHLKDHKVHWLSVGDSYIYLYQNHELTRLNELHTYEMQLKEMVQKGTMSEAEAMAQPNKAALTSYIGAGEIARIDRNTEAVVLNPNDRIVLMSDGIKTVSTRELNDVLRYDVEEAALKIRYLIEQKNKRNQDNFTAIIVEDNFETAK